MSKQVEFFFDVGSPASYLAWTQLPALCQRHDVQLIARPMLLGGVFKAVGNQPPGMLPPRGRYMITDLGRHARRYQVPLEMNPFFPVNTLLPMRVLAAAEGSDQLENLINALFQAMWVNPCKLSELEEMARVLSEAGLDAEHWLRAAGQDEAKLRLKATTEEAVARGAFGAPTMFVGEEMFFGQDRLDFVAEVLAG